MLIDADNQKKTEAERRERDRLEDIRLAQEYTKLLEEQDAKR